MSAEQNRDEAIKKLKSDIRNTGRHVLRFQSYCSPDFCSNKKNNVDCNDTRGLSNDDDGACGDNDKLLAKFSAGIK